MSGHNNSPNSNRDRLLAAKKNRQTQLEKWERFEKENQKINQNGTKESHRANSRNIQFSEDVILLEAVSRNDIKEVTELLRQGVNPNSVTIDGLTGLHQCCIDDYYEMGNLLLNYNANVNAVDSEMWTPLHAAATCGNEEMCKLLIKHGADFLAINADGNMPYDICEGNETLTIIETEMAKRNITQEQIDQARLVPEQQVMNAVKELIKFGESLDTFDSQGAAILHIACSLGYNEVVKILLEAGANHSLPDKEGWMPIHIAACWNYLDIVENLVVFGANINDTNSNNDTVFEICEPQFKEKLLYIKNNVETIRRNYEGNRLPQSKSFRKSRGSSIRRSSVRHKNMMSRKEAKEEFITMNQQPIITPPDDKNDENHGTSNDDDNSDIDSYIVVGSHKEISIPPQNHINIPAVKLLPVPKNVEEPSENNSIPFSQSPRSSTRNSNNVSNQKPKKATRAPPPPDLSKFVSEEPNNNMDKQPDQSSQEIITLRELPSKNNTLPNTNNGVDALNRPRYLFSGNSDMTIENKKSGKRKCCAIL